MIAHTRQPILPLPWSVHRTGDAHPARAFLYSACFRTAQATIRMAFIAPILEAAVRDREDWEAEDDPAVLSTREGLAVDLAATHYMTPEASRPPRRLEPLDDQQHAIVQHGASTEESRYRLWLKDALRR